MTVFANKTQVPIAKSRAEIESMLVRYKASKFASGWSEKGASLLFEVQQRRVRFELPMPDRGEKRFVLDQYHRRRAVAAQDRLYDQECRARWRALALVIKAKLEAVESGITTFEEEFLAHIVLPDGTTLGQWAAPRLAHVYDTGAMPPMLPGGPS